MARTVLERNCSSISGKGSIRAPWSDSAAHGGSAGNASRKPILTIMTLAAAVGVIIRQQVGTPAKVLTGNAPFAGWEAAGQQEWLLRSPVRVAEAMPVLRQAVTLAASRTPRNALDPRFISLNITPLRA